MSTLRFAFSLLSCVLLAGQLSVLSSNVDAAEKKTTKSKPKIAKSDTAQRQCCMPGAVCPTPVTDSSAGCKCCGFRVHGTLLDYNGKGVDSTMDVGGITVTFVVTDDTTDGKMKAIGTNKEGEFILKSKKFPNSPSPTGFGMRLECIDVGNTSISDQTEKFVLGTGVSDTVFEVIEALLNAVPKYDPELAEDKKQP
ncbi:MAG TPA: hypothetical protein VJ746_15615 [Nitrospira sp.]|nr:hypothetical protein [Nitrospira sp.]